METAAERYRRRKREIEAKALENVTCPECKEKWVVKREGLTFWISSGMMPAQLAASYMDLHKSGKVTEADILASLTTQQFTQSIEFTSKVVRHTAVEPKIVENPTEPNEIGFDEVMQCCYNTLRDWQLKGGEAGASLATFPK